MSWLEGYAPPYSITGPFVDNSPPGLAAAFFTKFEGWIANTDAPPATTISGSTSGTASLYQMPWNTLKVAMCICTNFRNGGASNQSITLPIPFSTHVLFLWTSGMANCSLLLSGSVKTVQLNSGLGAPSGTVTPVTAVGQNALGHCDTGFDTLQFNSGQSTAFAMGGILLVGL